MTVYNLYKYTTFETAVRILISEKIRFSSPSLFNDPFEFRFNAKNEKYGKIDQFKEYLKAKAGVFCISKSLNNILMLSHYADQHKGWIIEFEYVRNNCSLNPLTVLDLTNPYGGMLGYNEGVVDISEYLNNLHELLTKGLSPSEQDNTDNNIFGVVGTKGKEWEYEQEVRFLTSLSNNEKYKDVEYEECGMSIKSLYSGCRATEADKKIISQILDLKNKNIGMKEAVNYL